MRKWDSQMGENRDSKERDVSIEGPTMGLTINLALEKLPGIITRMTPVKTLSNSGWRRCLN